MLTYGFIEKLEKQKSSGGVGACEWIEKSEGCSEEAGGKGAD
jgi:hypothetical protein